MSLFSYTKEQELRILRCLQAQGFTRMEDWPDYLIAINKCVRVARAMEVRERQSASKAEGQLATFGNRITAALSAFEKMPRPLQDQLDHNLPYTIGHFMGSLTPTERMVVNDILTAPRLALLMDALRQAAKMAKDELSSKIVPVSDEAMSMLPEKVREKVRENSQSRPRRPIQDQFAYKGDKRDEGIRHAIPTLCEIFKRATAKKDRKGKPKEPTVFKNEHKDDGYGGTLYEFAMAALLPANIAPKDKLPHRILEAYEDWKIKKPS